MKKNKEDLLDVMVIKVFSDQVILKLKSQDGEKLPLKI